MFRDGNVQLASRSGPITAAMFTASQPTILRFSYTAIAKLKVCLDSLITCQDALLFRCVDLDTICVYDCGGKVTTGIVLSTIHSSYICKLTTMRDQ